MGFFRSLVEFGKDMGEIARDVGTLAKESRQEFTEIMTDGFKEMVIKDNNDYKTSFEKRDQANAIIAGARGRLNSKVDELNTYAKETENLIREFYQFKIHIAKQVIQSARKTMDYFIKFDMSNKITQPMMKTMDKIEKADVSLSVQSSLSGSLIHFSSVFGQVKRVQEANDYLEDAKDFRSKVNYEIARLDTIQARMRYIREVMKDERSVLQKLSSNLRVVVNEINSYLAKDTFSKEDVSRADRLLKITEVLHNLIVETFIEKDLVVSEKYLKDLVQLEHLVNKSHFTSYAEELKK